MELIPIGDIRRTQSASIISIYFYVLMENRTQVVHKAYEIELIVIKKETPAIKDRLPIKFISYFAFSNRYTPFHFEKYLKSDSGRAFLKKYDITR
ncbi:MAG: hypothetical protein WCT77_10250 [Bacteroidota bacterium]